MPLPVVSAAVLFETAEVPEIVGRIEPDDEPDIAVVLLELPSPDAVESSLVPVVEVPEVKDPDAEADTVESSLVPVTVALELEDPDVEPGAVVCESCADAPSVSDDACPDDVDV